MTRNVAIIIPCYKPDEKFIAHLINLKNNGYTKIIVINDGSGSEYDYLFNKAQDEFKCIVLKHSINLGQGRAYKTGFNYYLSQIVPGGEFSDTIGIIQCDCDGQHSIEDIKKCEELLEASPDKFILGVRDFSDKTIPFRSRFGNKCTSLLFSLCCGLDLKDTQTGLKGIPKSFIPCLMETAGERFEYASAVLLETKKQGIQIIQFPIETIYINGNVTSHFNPILDSIRIYSYLLKYIVSSLSAFIVDILAFTLFIKFTKKVLPLNYIIASTYSAKVLSCIYSFFVNKMLVFKHSGSGVNSALKFSILCVVQASLSAFITNYFVRKMQCNEVVCKVIVDTLLFFISFEVQNRWVFKRLK